MINTIHIILDEKFIDCAIDQFNNIEYLNNRYIYFRPSKKIKLKHIKNESLIEFLPTKKQLKILLCESKYDILILHSLTLNSSILLHIPKKIKVVWLSWGWDIYTDTSFSCLSNLPIKLSLYKPITRKYLNHDIRITINRLLRNLYFFYRRKIIYRKMIQRIDFCSTVLPNEEKLLHQCKYYKAQYFYFRYGSSKSEIKYPHDLSSKFKGNKILFGNSSTLENNHLDIIEKLDQINLNKREIIVPLSYGDEIYKKHLLSKIRFSIQKYTPLLTFIPPEKYKEFICSCSHVIMGHIRQQGIGNIFLSIGNGCKVFLYKDSIAYQYLKSMGYYIYSIDDDLNEKELSTNLTDDEIIHNRILASERTSLTKMKEKLELSLKKIIEQK